MKQRLMAETVATSWLLPPHQLHFCSLSLEWQACNLAPSQTPPFLLPHLPQHDRGRQRAHHHLQLRQDCHTGAAGPQ